MDTTAGFWSYVHSDDRACAGLIRELGTQLQQQYEALTGESLSLFVDRDDLRWGDEWTKRIDEAIAGTTFFIPIITPSYFRSQECRRELLKFSSEARRLGLEKLLLPVHWINVPELGSEATTDEAVALVSRHHWQDLRNIWLEEPDSSAFRKGVYQLASELVQRAEQVTELAVPPPGPAVETGPRYEHADEEDDDDAPGPLDEMAAQEAAAEAVTEILNAMGVEIVVVGEITQTATQKLEEAALSPQPVRAGLAVTQRMAQELDPPATRIEQLGHQFAAALVQLDPAITNALDEAAANPEDPDREEFLEVMEELAAEAEPALENLRVLLVAADEISRYARALRRPVRKLRTGLQGVLDGKALIDEWNRRAQEIRALDQDRV